MSDFFDDKDVVETDSSFFDSSDVVEEDTSVVNLPIAAALGAARDVTMGFSDELAGAGSALGELALRSPREDILSRYRQTRDLTRQLTKQVEEEYPVATTIGGLAGSLATAPFTGGAGIAARGASLGSRLLQAGKIGAVGGALTAAGQSESESIPEIAGDVQSGALFSAALGGAMPLGGAVIRGTGFLAKGAKDLVTDQPITEDFSKAFWRAVNGEKVAGAKAFERIGQESQDVSEEVVEVLSDVGSRLAKQQRAVLQAADESGKTLDLSKLISSITEKADDIPRVGQYAVSDIKRLNETQQQIIAQYGLPKAKRDALLNAIGDERNELIAEGLKNLEKTQPSVANTIKRTFDSAVYQRGQILPELLSQEGQSVARGLGNEIRKELGQEFGDLAVTNKLIKEFNDTMSLIGLADVNNPSLDSDDVRKLKRGISNLILSKEGETKSSIISRDAIKQLDDVLTKIDKNTRDKVIPKIQDIAERVDLARKSVGSGNQIGAFLNIQGKVITAGQALGQLYGATPETLRSMAEFSVRKFGEAGSAIATKLNDAAGANPQQRRAILYSLMQNPEYRRLMLGDKQDGERD